MTSWVHLFSKFSSEALLFEGFLVCVGITLYAAWAILKKRRELAAEEQIPGSVVKVYLNELITEAEQMRGQLYGLLQASGGKLPEGFGQGPIQVAAPRAGAAGAAPAQAGAASPFAGLNLKAGDPEIQNKIASVEAKMQAQNQAMELLVNEKLRLERELQLAKSASGSGSSGASGGGGGDDETSELKKKIQALETKLSEYSVIEDDLANLKKLQQENAQLKVMVSEQEAALTAAKKAAAAMPVAAAAAPAPAAAAAAPAPSAPAPAPAPAPAAAAQTPAPTPAAAPAAAPASGATAAPADDFLAAGAASATLEAPVVAPVPADAAPPADAEDGFAALTAQVDASLGAAPQAAAPAPAPAPAAAAPADDAGKSEEDLLAEFEKMLNG